MNEIDAVAFQLQSCTCLPLPEGLSFDDWETLGRRLAKMEKGVQWWVGDWWIYGHKYGERAKAAAKGIFGRSYGGLRNIGVVAREFEMSRRRDVLSFAHHAEVAALDPAKADTILDAAETNGWSRQETRAAVSRHKARERLPEYDDALTCELADLHAAIRLGKRFGTIYADPPWRYDNQGTRAATYKHYKPEVDDETGIETQPASGMTVEEICALPVRELAAPDAHLHLWTTNAFLFECPKIFDAWGFEFRTSFVWVKPDMGIGNYWRNSHEILLTAVRGNAKRFNDHSMMSWLECRRGRHSAKPEKIRDFLERASPGPRLELFGRGLVEGWAVWGNEVERTMFTHNICEVA